MSETCTCLTTLERGSSNAYNCWGAFFGAEMQQCKPIEPEPVRTGGGNRSWIQNPLTLFSRVPGPQFKGHTMVFKALTIAGSDSGGGAGIQADLKAFSAMGVYGASALTAVTAQNTRAVTAVHPVPDDVVVAQIEAVLSDIEIGAIKIGMLGTPSLIKAVAGALQGFDGPVVLDPVMVAKSGDTLLADSAIDTLKTYLLPRATVLTPNLPEASKLLEGKDYPVLSQAHDLLALGPKAVLMKGGHADGKTCTDYLCTGTGEIAQTVPRVMTQNTHGTGCSYSSAIAACLAKGKGLEEAVCTAHNWLHSAILRSDELNVGQGHGPVHHFHGMWG